MTIVLEHPGQLDLSRVVRPGDGLVWGQACAEPVALTTRLMQQAPALGPLTGFVGVTLADAVDPAQAPDLVLSSYCASGRNRSWYAAGCLQILPAHYSALPGLFARGIIRADVVLLSVAPADEDGGYALGLADEYLSGALDAARVVIVEVSSRVPHIPGTRTLRPEQVDIVVHTEREPVEMPTTQPGATERALAAQVADLIPDGATLQIGLGSFPGAVLSALAQHNDLGVHSGLISDGVADLADRGVITNAAKGRDVAVTVAGTVMGTRRLFDWVDGNPAVRLRSTSYTHAPEILSSLRRFTAINSALEVDLTGQVNTEFASGRYLGAVGGILDFLRGAARSEGGLPIVALTAATRGASRIVRTLSGPATVGRADVGVVVTEFGAVDLRGMSLPERREALISIAHPAHRSELSAAGDSVDRAPREETP